MSRRYQNKDECVSMRTHARARVCVCVCVCACACVGVGSTLRWRVAFKEKGTASQLTQRPYSQDKHEVLQIYAYFRSEEKSQAGSQPA